MNSSVKYKKFDNSQGNEEKKPQEFRSKSKFLAIVLVIVAVAFVTISVTAVSIGVGVGVSRQSSGLTVIVIYHPRAASRRVLWLSWRYPFSDYRK